MDSVASEAEQMLLEWILRHLDRPEQKNIYNGEDVLRSLSMDAEDEVKERVWELVKRELNYRWIVDKVKDEVANQPETDNEEDEEDEDLENGSQSDTD
jgi:HEPN domain-containing protein